MIACSEIGMQINQRKTTIEMELNRETQNADSYVFEPQPQQEPYVAMSRKIGCLTRVVGAAFAILLLAILFVVLIAGFALKGVYIGVVCLIVVCMIGFVAYIATAPLRAMLDKAIINLFMRSMAFTLGVISPLFLLVVMVFIALSRMRGSYSPIY